MLYRWSSVPPGAAAPPARPKPLLYFGGRSWWLSSLGPALLLRRYRTRKNINKAIMATAATDAPAIIPVFAVLDMAPSLSWLSPLFPVCVDCPLVWVADPVGFPVVVGAFVFVGPLDVAPVVALEAASSPACTNSSRCIVRGVLESWQLCAMMVYTASRSPWSCWPKHCAEPSTKLPPLPHRHLFMIGTVSPWQLALFDA